MAMPCEEIKRRLRYDPKTGYIYWRDGERLAGRRAFTYTNKRGYFVTTFRGKSGDTTLAAHRVAWLLHHGVEPTGQIDHVNGDRLDNRIGNLRDVVNAENARNACICSNNTSGMTGVYRHSQTRKWVAQINAFGKTISLGCYHNFGDAVIARKAAERVLGYHKNHGRPPL